MDRFPSAEHGPRYEMQSIGRSCDDLAPDDRASETRDVWTPLLFSLVGLILLMAFVGWLLVSRPLNL